MSATPRDEKCSGEKSAPPEHPVHGTDGKHYPGRYAPKEVRDYLFGRTHYLRHADELSVRGIVSALADEGYRRSVGWVAGILKQPCEWCSGDVPETPEHAEASQ